jgi:DNA adenine methylase
MKKISAFPYPGGKFYLMDDITRYIRTANFKLLVDVFGGSGKVLINIETSATKVYNDADGRLVNVFMQIRDNKEELLKKFEFAIRSRQLFEESNIPSPIPVDDAYRFLYRQYTNFAGKRLSDSYGYILTDERDLDVTRIADIIKTVHNEIRKWNIEHMDFQELIEKYDSPNTLFYLDPPYWNVKFYDHNFIQKDFVRLANSLKTVKGKYLMNINADPNVVRIFGKPTESIEYINHTTLASDNDGSRTKRMEFFYSNIVMQKQTSLFGE